jgi:hypothetical protein
MEGLIAPQIHGESHPASRDRLLTDYMRLLRYIE